MNFEQCNNKNILFNALMDTYTDVRIEYRLPRVSTRIDDYKDSPCYASLKSIYDFLLKLDKSANALRKNRIGQSGEIEDCDIVLRERKQIIEYDEGHHFSQIRGETLKFYPTNLDLGFNKTLYESLCTRNIKAVRMSSIWNDVLRDFLPLTHGYQPTIRIIEKDSDFIGINPMSRERSIILERLDLPQWIGSTQAEQIATTKNQDEKKNSALLKAHATYGTAYWNHRITASSLPSSHETGPTARLHTLYRQLSEFCGYDIIVKQGKMSECDIYIPSEMKVIELDERQHFSLARAQSLTLYDQQNVDFDTEFYIQTCKRIRATDKTPVYRDGQRAWFDTVKDHLPLIHEGFKPVQRVACI